MSALPNNTFASPGNPYYALEGGGGGDSLQSPVSLLPEAGGNQSLSIVASTGSGEADILVSSTNGNDATITINSTQGGDAAIAIGQGAVPGGSGYALITAPGAVVGGGQIQIENGSGTGGSIATFDTVGNQVYLGGIAAAGLTTVRNGLRVNDQFVVPDPTAGIGLTMTAPLTGVIAMSSATGSLSLGSGSSNPDIIQLTQSSASPDTGICTIGGNGGENLVILGGTVANPTVGVNLRTDAASSGVMTVGSSVANPDIINLSDGASADTGVCKIGGNGGTNLSITGGTVAAANVGANIRTDAASSGIMTIGSSVANPTVMFVKDAGAANTGFVDVAGGIPASIALRLQGANTAVGANTAQISTNNVNSASPTLNINNSVDGTPAIVVSSTTVRINKLITGYLNGTTAAQPALLDNNQAGIPGSDYGSLGAGLFAILATTAVQGTSGQPATNVSSMGYMSSVTQKWIGGNGFGQALINPTRNMFIAVNSTFTGLNFGNTAGFYMNATYTVTFIRLTGDLGI
jgi:hypothetical protein